jgi:hypothetical protein
MKSIVGFVLILSLGACGYFQPKELEEEKPVARVNETYLYPSDVEGLIPLDISAEDSLILAERFVDEWIRRQLMIEKAREETDLNEAEIESKVQEYRYALTRSAYEKAFIQKNLNTEVSEDEISRYYEDHKADFILKQNIVRCLFAKIPQEAPRIKRFTANFQKYPETPLSELREYCTQFAQKAFLEDSVWVDFTEVISSTPFEEILNERKILLTRSFLQNQDSTHVYLLNVLGYKTVDDVSPIEFVQEDIRNILINKRKIALKRELEEKIYNDAARNDAFEVFDR